MGIPTVVYTNVSDTYTAEKQRPRETYVNGEVQEVERARVRRVVIGPAREHASRHRRGRSRLDLDVEPARRQHGHEDVGNVDEDRAKHLLGHVKEPNLDGPLRALLPALVHEDEQGQATEGQLHEEGKVAEELAVALGGLDEGGHGHGGGGVGGCC